MKKNIIMGLISGFIVGGAVGLLLGQSTRKEASNNIKSGMVDGIIKIELDVKNTLKQGLLGLF